MTKDDLKRVKSDALRSISDTDYINMFKEDRSNHKYVVLLFLLHI